MANMKPCPFCGGEAYFCSADTGIDCNYPAVAGCEECGIFFGGNLHRIVNGFYTKQDIEESNTIAIKKWNTRVYPGDETAEYFILPKPKEKLANEYSAIKCDSYGVPHAAIGYEIIQDAFNRWQDQIDAEIRQKLFEAFRPVCKRVNIEGETYLFGCSACGNYLIDDDNFCSYCGAKVVKNEQA